MASELSDFELLLADSSNSHQSLSRLARQGCCLITIVVWHILQSPLVKGGDNLRSLPTNFLHGCLGLANPSLRFVGMHEVARRSRVGYSI
jgi:hypothetical protein